MTLTIDTNSSQFVDVIRKNGNAIGSLKRGRNTRTQIVPDLYFAGIGEDAKPCARVWPKGKAPADNPTPSIPYVTKHQALQLVVCDALMTAKGLN